MCFLFIKMYEVNFRLICNKDLRYVKTVEIKSVLPQARRECIQSKKLNSLSKAVI